jgi:hypothetical protein
MNMEISEEAKEAPANAQLIRSRNRLRKDGCSSGDAFRKRVLLLAAERNLLPAAADEKLGTAGQHHDRGRAMGGILRKLRALTPSNQKSYLNG